MAVTGILVYVYAIKNRKGKYIISGQYGVSTKQSEERGQELTVSQSMREANPETVKVSSVVQKKQDINDKKEDIIELKEKESKINDKVDDKVDDKADEKKSNSSNSNNSSSSSSSSCESSDEEKAGSDEDEKNTQF